ncbi:unnamed protein product [Urochloa humidicola]
MKESDCCNNMIAAYCQKVHKLEEKFVGLELKHIPKRLNEAADALAKMVLGWEPVLTGIFISDQHEPSVRPPRRKQDDNESSDLDSGAHKQKRGDIEFSDLDLRAGQPSTLPIPEVMEVDNEEEAHADDSMPAQSDSVVDWRTPYLDYLLRGILPANKTKARCLARCAKSFAIIDGELYKRSMTEIQQRCISIEQGWSLPRDIHSGVCGHHAAPRSLVGNAFRHSFYWSTTMTDATHIICTCEGCQFYAQQTHMPTQALQTIPVTWPFAIWGLDLVVPLRKAPGGYTHLLVAVDKFTKWIEARTVSKVRSEEAVEFFLDIVYRIGVPNSIITDNCTQFSGKSS